MRGPRRGDRLVGCLGKCALPAEHDAHPRRKWLTSGNRRAAPRWLRKGERPRWPAAPGAARVLAHAIPAPRAGPPARRPGRRRAGAPRRARGPGAAAAAGGVRPARPDPDVRCTRDGTACIARSTYIPDVCRTIEAAATAHGIDRGFFARLLWKESLFDAAAVSPAGAEGIAQFMPGTAKLRGLDDAFNPAEALYASAAYLADLGRAYGNLGLAAVAYNGGEARADRFVARRRRPPRRDPRLRRGDHRPFGRELARRPAGGRRPRAPGATTSRPPASPSPPTAASASSAASRRSCPGAWSSP